MPENIGFSGFYSSVQYDNPSNQNSIIDMHSTHSTLTKITALDGSLKKCNLGEKSHCFPQRINGDVVGEQKSGRVRGLLFVFRSGSGSTFQGHTSWVFRVSGGFKLKFRYR